MLQPSPPQLRPPLCTLAIATAPPASSSQLFLPGRKLLDPQISDGEQMLSPERFWLHTTKESLWMENRSTSGWVEEKEEAIWQQEHTCLNPKTHSLDGELAQSGYPTFTLHIQDQQPPFRHGWEKLSIEEALATVVHMADLPCMEICICILQQCRKLENLEYSRRTHVCICAKGLEVHEFLGNYIVTMFADCGSISDAQRVFNGLASPNEHSLTSLLSAYTQCEQPQHALTLYERIQENSVLPSTYTLVALLKACATLKDLQKGQEFHNQIMQMGFERVLHVGNTLVGMYVNCGSLLQAQEVFDKLPVRDSVSWNAVMAGYAEHGLGQELLNCLQTMELEGVCLDAITYTCIMKACSIIGALEKGQEMHMDIAKKGYERDHSIGKTLISMYAKCGLVLETQDIFDRLPAHDVVSWTALIAGYAEHGPAQEALYCLNEMQLEGVSPNAVTFACSMKACSSIGDIEKAQEIHMDITKKGFERDLLIGNTVLCMYAKCNSLLQAQDVFDKLPARDVVSYNAVIAGYAEIGPRQEALRCFNQMQLETIAPDTVTYACVLKACGSIGAIEKGQEIHKEVEEKGFESDLQVGSSLVGFYSKCGLLSKAREVFDKLPVHDVVSWNLLIGGFAEHGPGQEALKCFEQMRLEQVSADAVTFACMLKACGTIGAINKGREIHIEIAGKGFVRDSSISNSLISMYGKCGLLLEAREVFDKILVRDVVTWSLMIKAYGMNHEGKMAVKCFEDMQQEGTNPDAITFSCLISACSHSSLVSEGREYFKVMREEYGITPSTEHYTSMVDLLCRSGLLYEAERFLEMLGNPHEETWAALLSACKTYIEAEAGRRCFQQLVLMNPEVAAWYVLMADIYVSSDRWGDAFRVEELRKHAGAKKKPATAVIELNKTVHEFMVGNNQSKEISALLSNLSSCMEEERHVPNVDLVLRHVSDHKKEATLCEHAEKLAIAFGILNTIHGETLRITKNLRMCNDCHNASKVLSKIERREIILRDDTGIHHFKDGLCSCGDMF